MILQMQEICNLILLQSKFLAHIRRLSLCYLRIIILKINQFIIQRPEEMSAFYNIRLICTNIIFRFPMKSSIQIIFDQYGLAPIKLIFMSAKDLIYFF